MSASCTVTTRAGREAWWSSPGDLELNLALADRLLRLEPPRATEAARHLTVATTLAPRSAGLRVRLGDACRAAGEEERAAAAYRNAVSLDPDWAEARRRSR